MLSRLLSRSTSTFASLKPPEIRSSRQPGLRTSGKLRRNPRMRQQTPQFLGTPKGVECCRFFGLFRWNFVSDDWLRSSLLSVSISYRRRSHACDKVLGPVGPAGLIARSQDVPWPAFNAGGRHQTVESAAVNGACSQMVDRSTCGSQSGCFEAVKIEVP